MKLFHKLSDWAAVAFGSEWFFLFHLLWWGGWVLFSIEAFPYGLLTLIVSLESILLSGLILNATNRSGNIDRIMMIKDLKTNNNNLQIDKDTHVMVERILEILEEKNGGQA